MNYKTIKLIYGSKANEFSKLYNIDANWILAVIKQESNGNFLEVAPTPDIGLMQLTQPALTDYNNMFNQKETLLSVYINPLLNMKIGSWYLGWLFSQFNNRQDLAISAYNQGIGNVKKDSFDRGYWDKVKVHYEEFKKL